MVEERIGVVGVRVRKRMEDWFLIFRCFRFDLLRSGFEWREWEDLVKRIVFASRLRVLSVLVGF